MKGETGATKSLLVSGNVIQIREYEKPLRYGYLSQRLDYSKKKDVSIGNQVKAINRARAQVFRIANSNFGLKLKGGKRRAKFLTATYKENVQDRERVCHDLNLLIKKIEYDVQEKIQYIGVMERQKRGAFHLHLLLESPFIPFGKLVEYWNSDNGKGGIDLREAWNAENLGAYMAKYISKDLGVRSGKERNKKRYFNSHGMVDRSITMRFPGKSVVSIESIQSMFPGSIRQARDFEYSGEYTGSVKGRELVLTPCEMSVKLIREMLFYASKDCGVSPFLQQMLE